MGLEPTQTRIGGEPTAVCGRKGKLRAQGVGSCREVWSSVMRQLIEWAGLLQQWICSG